MTMSINAIEAKYYKHINQDMEFPKKGVLYRGVVVDNVDPEKFGRVKVLIEGVTPTIAQDEKAMWAWTMNIFGGGQENGMKYGGFMPYPKGAKVFVLFEPSVVKNSNPVIIGGWYQQDQKPIDAYDRYEGDGVIPNAWGWQTPKGHIIACREEKDHLQIELKTPGNRKCVISDQTDEEVITLVGAKGNEITLYEGKKGIRIQLLDKDGNTILIDNNTNSITVMAKENILLKAKNIYLMAEEDITTVASQDLSMTAAKSTTIQGKAQTLLGNDMCLTSVEGATIKMEATTAITETAPTVTITAPTISIEGMVTLTGTLSVVM
jgi:phage baseplate assembly protein gpV